MSFNYVQTVVSPGTARISRTSNYLSNISGSYESTKKNLKSQAIGEAKRTTQSQTDKDTAKVIQSTVTGLDAAKASVSMPLLFSNATQASLAMERAAANLTQSSLQTMASAGHYIDPNIARKKELNPYFKIKDSVINADLEGKRVGKLTQLKMNVNNSSFMQDLRVGYLGRAETYETHKIAGEEVRVFKNSSKADLTRGIKDYNYHMRTAQFYKDIDSGAFYKDPSNHKGISLSQGMKVIRESQRKLGLPEDLERFERATKIYQNSQYKIQTLPKAWGMSMFRVATISLQNSDTMKGFHLNSAYFRGLKTADTFLFKPCENLAYNAGAAVYNKTRIAFYARKEGYRTFGLKKAQKQLIKQKAKNYINFNAKKPLLKYVKLKEISKGSPIRTLPLKMLAKGNNALASKLFARHQTSALLKGYSGVSNAILQKVHGQIGKDAFKKTVKIVMQNSGRAAFNKIKSDTAKATIKTTFKFFGKVGNVVTKPFKAVLSPLKWLSNLLSKAVINIKTSFAKMGKIIAPYIGKAAFIMGFAIFLMYFLTFLAYGVDALMGVFVMDDGEKYVARAKAIYSEIKECHEDTVDEITNIYKGKETYLDDEGELQTRPITALEGRRTKTFDAGDVEYINGANENYKEVWAATSLMLQQDLNNFSNTFWGDDGKKALKALARENYRNTHRVTYRPYKFKNNDGEEKMAVHVYVNILRDEACAYEFLSLWPKNEKDLLEEGTPITYDSGDWISTVKAIKCAYSRIDTLTKERDNVYIDVNGSNMYVRYDQSGFVSACLRAYGSLGANESSYGLLTSSGFSGFVRFSASIGSGGRGGYTFNSLKEGDILVGDRGCSIFSHYVGNNMYIYDGSRAGTTYAGTITEDFVRNYSVVFRPVDPGSIHEEIEYEINEDYDFIHYFPKYTNLPLMGDPEEYSEEEMMEARGVFLLGNEDGALPVLKADLLDVANNPGKFTADHYFFDDTVIATMPVYDSVTGELMKDETARQNTENAENSKGAGLDHIMMENLDNDNLSSTDFVRYMLARHGIKVPFSDSKALLDMGDMVASGLAVTSGKVNPEKIVNTGDIIWYLQEGINNDFYYTFIKEHDFDIWDAEPGTYIPIKHTYVANYDGFNDTKTLDDYTENFPLGQVLLNNAIPLICIDDKTCIGYSENILIGHNKSEAGIHIYNIKDLNLERIWYIHRPVGYTIKPVYGSNMFFEGWTDYNISFLMELLDDDCWETGSFDMHARGEVYDEGTITDWSWYSSSDGNFVDSSTIWDKGYTKDQYVEFNQSVSKMVYKQYEDTGILPSVSFAVAHALSNGRTTEESLAYNNIYEFLAEDFESDERAVRIHHTTYDEDGTATATYLKYRKYADYEEAHKDWTGLIDKMVGIKTVEGLHDPITDLDVATVLFNYQDPMRDHTQAEEQLAKLYSSGIIDGETYDKALEVLNGYHEGYIDTVSHTAYGSNVEDHGTRPDHIKPDGTNMNQADVYDSLVDSLNTGAHYDETLMKDIVKTDRAAIKRRELIENIEYSADAIVIIGEELLASVDADTDYDEYKMLVEYVKALKTADGLLEYLDTSFFDEDMTTNRSLSARHSAESAIGEASRLAGEIVEKHKEAVKRKRRQEAEEFLQSLNPKNWGKEVGFKSDDEQAIADYLNGAEGDGSDGVWPLFPEEIDYLWDIGPLADYFKLMHYINHG